MVRSRRANPIAASGARQTLTSTKARLKNLNTGPSSNMSQPMTVDAW